MSGTGDVSPPRYNFAISKPTCINIIMLIYLVSGACSLIDEVVWVRLLKLTLGNTVYASSIVVSVFMGGLALGALIMSKYSDRVKKHLKLYAFLETLVTISALFSPWALKLVDNIYIWFYQKFHPAHWQLLMVQVIISGIILLIPSMLMGSTLPLLGRFVTAFEKEAGHLVGKLYALNTLGAAAGCFLAGFVLIRSFGVMGTLFTAAIMNVLVAIGGWVLSGFKFSNEKSKETPSETAEIKTAETKDFKFYILVAAFFASGLISIGYELIWMRSIVHLLGGFTYIFSAVLTIYLVGNVIGAGIGCKLAGRLKRPAAGFAATLFILGVYGILYLPILTIWTSKILNPFKGQLDAVYSKIPPFQYLIGPIIQSAILFLIPTIVMGIGFPMALQAWTSHVHKIGKSTGTAYGANTIGAVLGGIVTGFVLIPLLGVQISITILSLIGIWMAGFMWFFSAERFKVVGHRTFLALAVLFTVLAIIIPPYMFNLVVNTSPLREKSKLLYMKEGLTTTVSIHRSTEDDALSLCSSGQGIAGEHYATRGDQKMLGHFGVLLNKNISKVLSVGFGAGETTACLDQHNLETIDCVEIAPEVVDVSLRFFRHLNLGDKLNEKVNMIFMDAKNYLHLTDKSYDSIVNDSIHPRSFAENASLYAKEYFESAKEHLEPNGIFLSWLPFYDMPADVLKSIIGTQMEVFPYVTLWFMTTNPSSYVLVVGSENQQYFSPNYIDNELRKNAVRESLENIDIYTSMDVLSCYIGDKNDLKKYVEGFSTNSDYQPFIEFITKGVTPHQQNFRELVMNTRNKSLEQHIDWSGFTKEQKTKWLEDYQKLHEVSSYLLLSYESKNYLDNLEYVVQGLTILPDNPALVTNREKIERVLLNISKNLIDEGKMDTALAGGNDMIKTYPQSAAGWVVRSIVTQKRDKNLKKALFAAITAVKYAPDNADARMQLGLILYELGKYKEAVAEFEKMVSLANKKRKPFKYNRAKMLYILANAYFTDRKVNEAIETAQKALEISRFTKRRELTGKIKELLLLLEKEYHPTPK
ncbi:MAG: fused MFS/spermidine synthase [Planctomycetota bacterium]|jgi:spermidine synthase